MKHGYVLATLPSLTQAGLYSALPVIVVVHHHHHHNFMD
jgi:hypothetical protein